ncbi:MAG: type 1 glutamine amidotransferase domain-containing protein [Desulfitobacteriaceae bacterium]
MEKKIAIFTEEMYDEREFWYPYYRMQEAGFKVVVVGTGRQLTFLSKHGIPITPDITADSLKTDDYEALIIPGGFAPDKMRINQAMLQFVRDMMAEGKLVATICHGGWVLVSADVLKGRKVTACDQIKHDLQNAGAEFLSQEVVVDGNLISSRTPPDLPAFCKALVSYLA